MSYIDYLYAVNIEQTEINENKGLKTNNNQTNLYDNPSVVIRHNGNMDPLKIHYNLNLVDLHCDTLLNISDNNTDIAKRNNIGHIDIPRMIGGGVDIQVFAAWVAPDYYPDRSFERTATLIKAFKGTVRSTSVLEQAYNTSDLKRIKKEGKIAAILAIEAGDALEGKLENLDYFYRQGVRYITLTWNYSNQIADGVSKSFKGSNRSNGGLTPFGRAVIERMNQLGMLVDVSHLSEESFWDVIKASKSLVIASHSNAWQVCNHERNLKDEQIVAIASKGGVIGVANVAPYLNDSGEATIDDIIKHINYIVDLVGINHVSIGSDFDGTDEVAKDLEDSSYFPNLTRRLIEEGYTLDDVKKIMGENFIRVFKEVCK
ncbi:MAG: dipeptidase [Deferribacterota bacterium]|nr:dipeptidase [Deferribacterota bacterium]